MKKIITIFFIFFFLIMGLAKAQDCIWAKSAGGKLSDYGNSISTDHSGNVYVIGDFNSDSMLFGSTIIYHYFNPIYSNTFFAKYDINGNVLWAKSIGSVGNANTEGYGVTTDNDDNVYITGYFEGDSISFGNITLYNSSTGEQNLYLVKYDSSGNVLWAKNPGGVYNEGLSVTTDLNNNIFITGYFQDNTISFDSDTLYLSVTWGYSDLFLFKFDSNGNTLWGRSAGGNYWEWGDGLSTDYNGNIYLTGYFSSDTSYFDTIIVINNYISNIAGGNDDMFLAKYDSSGNIKWVKSAGGNGISSGKSLSCDGNGNIYVGGVFNAINYPPDTIKFDSINLFNNSYNILMQSANTQLFFVKYDSSGSVQWAKCGISASSWDNTGNTLTSLCADVNGNIFITGSYTDSILIDSTTLYNGGYFLIKLNSNGNIIWAQNILNSGNSNSVCIDQNSNAFITGSLEGDSAIFGNNTIYNDSTQTLDIFIAKYGNLISGKNSNIQNFNGIILYPNPPSGTFTLSYNSQLSILNSQLKIYDVLGQEVYTQAITNPNQTTITVSQLSNGVYFYQLINNKETYRGKFVKE